MKALILSFFAVILGYSLIFDEKKTTDQPVIKDSNSVYVDSVHGSNTFKASFCHKG